MDWLLTGPSRQAATQTITLGEREVPVTVIRHPTARRMVLRLAPDGESVRVTIPRWGRTGEALAFARDRREWLAAQLAKLPTRNAPMPGGTIRFRGRELVIDWSPARPRAVQSEADAIVLGGPQERIEARIRAWLRERALSLVEQDVAHYASLADLAPSPVALSNARRRWGSCSVDGTMRINWRLVQAPDHVRRSVVAHEIAHRVHFDHSPRFHALLADLYGPGLAEAESWLRRNGPSLFASFG